MKNRKNYSILLVDGDDIDRQVLSKALDTQGYVFSMAKTAQQALAGASLEHFDLIVVASTLRDASGEDLIERLNNDPKTADVPKFVLINKRDENRIESAAAVGAKACFHKPLQVPVFLEAVNETLQQIEKSAGNTKVKVAKPKKVTYSVLVVDDQEMNLDFIVKRLTREGWLATGASSGKEGLQRLRERRYDLVLLDIMMPEMDGYEVLSKIKMYEEYRDIPVIMLTALNSMESVQQCLQLGANDYVAKPFEFARLREKMRSCLGIIG